jgi:hypothetical protein
MEHLAATEQDKVDKIDKMCGGGLKNTSGFLNI